MDKQIPCSCFRRLNISNNSNSVQLDLQISHNYYHNSGRIFVDTDKLKIYMIKELEQLKILKKNNKAGGITLPKPKTNYKAIVIRTSFIGELIIDQENRNSPETDPHKYGQLIFINVQKQLNGKKEFFQQMLISPQINPQYLNLKYLSKSSIFFSPPPPSLSYNHLSSGYCDCLST